MTLALGIDAAWTARGSSGIALLQSDRRERRVVACAPSYAEFVGLAKGNRVEWRKPVCEPIDVCALLDAAVQLGGAPVDVVAIDMPIAQTRINGRRAADQEVSRRFGSAWAGTHSPTAERPGRYGHQITQAFIGAGFSLAMSQTQIQTGSLIEVYPLAALVPTFTET